MNAGQVAPEVSETTDAIAAIAAVRRRIGSQMTTAQLAAGGRMLSDGLELLRQAVVATESGHRVTIASEVWQQTPWPANDEVAALLRRAARAFERPEHQISFAGSTLDRYRSHVMALQSSPGRHIIDTVEARYASLGAARAMAGVPELSAAVDAFYRTVSLRDFLPDDVAELYALTHSDREQPSRRQRSQVSDRRTMSSGTSDEYVTPRGPLSLDSSVGWYREFNLSEDHLYQDNPSKFFSVHSTDKNLDAAADWWRRPEDTASLSERVPGELVMSYFARRLELYPDEEMLHAIEGEFQRWLTKTKGDRESVLVALRLAQVAHIDFDSAITEVKGVDGQRLTLRQAAEHLRLPKYKDLKPVDVDYCFKRFEPGSAVSIEERVAAL